MKVLIYILQAGVGLGMMIVESRMSLKLFGLAFFIRGMGMLYLHWHKE